MLLRPFKGPLALPVLLGLTACGEDAQLQGVADPLRPATGTVVATIRHHFTGEVGVGVPVTLRRTGQDSRSSLTDPAGAATFLGVEVGVWKLSFQPPGGFVAWSTRPSSVDIAVAEGQTARHLFEYVASTETQARGDIQVAASEPSVGGFMAPVPGTRIRVEGGSTVVELTVERGAQSVVPDLVVGAYTVTAFPPRGYALADTESGTREVQVVQSYLTRVDEFRLKRTSGMGGLRGWVGTGPLDASFVAAAGATLRLVAEGTTVASAVAGPGGLYWVDDLEPAVYELEITLPAGWTVGDGAAVPSQVEVIENRLKYLNIFSLRPPG